MKEKVLTQKEKLEIIGRSLWHHKKERRDKRIRTKDE